MPPGGDGSPGPFGRIALCLSGGALRASSFHLGTLAYLDRLGLREDVKILSTVSGGSLPGTTYAVAMKEGKSFQEYFRWLYDFILNGKIVPWVLDHLTRREAPSPSGRRTMAAAFCDVLDEHLFEGRSFGMFFEPEPKMHLDTVIFNATEFKSGLAFRFQNEGLVGNGKIFISDEQAGKLRMSDVLGASACIPGGFEPLSFPQDFTWSDDDDGRKTCREIEEAFVRRLSTRHQKIDSVAIMDGGVYDNQGIESALLAAHRRSAANGDELELELHGQELTGPYKARWISEVVSRTEGVDTVLVSDAPLREDCIYEQAPPPAMSSWRLGWLSAAALVLLACSVGTVASVVIHFIGEFLQPGPVLEDISLQEFFLYVFPALLALGFAAGLVWIRRTFMDVLKEIPQLGASSWWDLRRLRVSAVADIMIKLRATSLIAMSNDIFLNRIRSLGYTVLYQEERKHDRIVSNEIYDLAARENESLLPSWLKPSEKLQALAERASNFPTTMWIDHQDDLDMLIACGQATCCYNILEHVESGRAERAGLDMSKLEPIRAKAVRDWKILQRDPFALLDKRLGRGNLVEVVPVLAEPPPAAGPGEPPEAGPPAPPAPAPTDQPRV